MAQKVLILGSQGMLGQELVLSFQSDPDFEVTGWDQEDLDVTDFQALRSHITSLKPDIIVNAVGYNAVDACEQDEAEYQNALLLNRDVPKELSAIADATGALLVHYSTDYVFDGDQENLKSGSCGGSCCGGNCHGGFAGYTEDALPNPLSRYGETKLAGEESVRQTKHFYLIRLSKLFGKPAQSKVGKKSFFQVMLELSKTQPEIKAVHEEMSCFTYAPDLAAATKALIEDEAEFGVYHLPNEGAMTWYEAVKELYREAHVEIPVVPVTAEEFGPRPAKRPKVSILANTKRPKLRPVSEAIQDFVRILQ